MKKFAKMAGLRRRFKCTAGEVWMAGKRPKVQPRCGAVAFDLYGLHSVIPSFEHDSGDGDG